MQLVLLQVWYKAGQPITTAIKTQTAPLCTSQCTNLLLTVFCQILCVPLQHCSLTVIIVSILILSLLPFRLYVLVWWRATLPPSKTHCPRKHAVPKTRQWLIWALLVLTCFVEAPVLPLCLCGIINREEMLLQKTPRQASTPGPSHSLGFQESFHPPHCEMPALHTS